MQRENFRSRLGFLLVSAGCAIGIGNVWRFPYITGQYGGGYFVLFYLICLVIMGIPVMTMELAVGRASRKSAVQAYQTLEKPGQKWHIHGWFCMLGCCLLMMYYTTVTGWMVDYFYKFLRGDFVSRHGHRGDRRRLQPDALLPRRNDHLYGHRGRSGLFGLQLWRAERPRAHHQGHDDRPAGPHRCAGGAQPDCCPAPRRA